jgi:hypothetical protein
MTDTSSVSQPASSQSPTSNAPQPTSYPQYLRKVGLIVSNASGAGLDLSQLRIKFHVEGASFGKPKTLIARVYNLAATTVATIKKEFQTVMLQAGYENGAYGIIFQGTIKRLKSGKESAIDTFLEIQAADGDMAFNFAFVNKTLAGGATYAQRAQVAIDAMTATGAVTSSDTTALQSTGGVIPAPRGTVMWGLAAAHLDDIAATTGTSWFIENGVVVFVSNTGFRSGDAVVLNAQTGMVGIPEATINGIEGMCLLNPNLKIGTRIQIDNKAITQTQTNGDGAFPAFSDFAFFANVNNDGFARVLVLEHYGDTRDNDYYSKFIALALDASAAPGSSVLAFG